MAALLTAQPLSVEEYLDTSYDPDVEFVDGVLVERNMGDWLHSMVQGNVLYALRRKYPSITSVPELRSRVSPTRFRLPDVSVVLSAPQGDYLSDAAFLVVEVLSQKDAMNLVMEKLREYSAKGVANIWLIDPRSRSMFTYSSGTLTEVSGDVIVSADSSIELTRGEIFGQ